MAMGSDEEEQWWWRRRRMRGKKKQSRPTANSCTTDDGPSFDPAPRQARRGRGGRKGAHVDLAGLPPPCAILTT
jgi:hypothetical protein